MKITAQSRKTRHRVQRSAHQAVNEEPRWTLACRPLERCGRACSCERLTPAIGADVTDVNLGALNDDTAQAVYDALIEHSVLFFRDQHLSPLQLVDLANHMGGLGPKHHAYNTHPDTGLSVVHDPGAFRNGAYEKGGNQGINDMLGSVGSAVWPIISHHPVTGRPYVNVSESNSRWIIGVGASESARIISLLLDMINRPDHQVRLRWRPGTIAIWDNRGTQHYGVSDYQIHRRVKHRVVVHTDTRLAAQTALATR